MYFKEKMVEYYLPSTCRPTIWAGPRPSTKSINCVSPDNRRLGVIHDILKINNAEMLYTSYKDGKRELFGISQVLNVQTCYQRLSMSSSN